MVRGEQSDGRRGWASDGGRGGARSWREADDLSVEQAAGVDIGAVVAGFGRRCSHSRESLV